jgi:purine nucleosidase/pyrimidine-specific ribonucleoside hydrolase
MPTPVIIDTDPGSDDAIALLMAFQSKNLRVKAIATVGGNCRPSQATTNALRILEHIGYKSVPVSSGSARPLGGSYGYAYDFHGPSGLPVRLPLPKAHPSGEHAVDTLARLLKKGRWPLVVALGPLTNMARLLQQHPWAANRIGHLVVMGGAVEVSGNITPHAEFNFYNDPLAADLVLASGIPVTLVDLKTCRQALATAQDALRLLKGNQAGQLAGRILLGWFRLHPDRQVYDLCDPLAMACAIDPPVATYRHCQVRVVVDDPKKLGMSYISRKRGDVALAVEVDKARFFSLLYDLFGVEK